MKVNYPLIEIRKFFCSKIITQRQAFDNQLSAIKFAYIFARYQWLFLFAH